MGSEAYLGSRVGTRTHLRILVGAKAYIGIRVGTQSDLRINMVISALLNRNIDPG